MSDMITAEEAQKHLDDFLALPGYLSEAITVGDLASRREEALRQYQGCAPDLARTALALHAQLADAKAAQAMVVERCMSTIQAFSGSEEEADYKAYLANELRALADTDGLALVQALRAERDDLRAAVEGLIAVLDRNGEKGPIPDVEMMFCWLAAQNVRAAFRNTEGRGDMTDDEALETLFAMANVQDGYAKKATDRGLKVIHKANAKAQREVAAAIKDLRARLASAEADRDRLAAANAALEAKLARLVGWQPPEDRQEGYRCLGWTEDGWVAVTWVQMGREPPRWFTDWYPERDDIPTAFAPLPAALAEVQGGSPLTDETAAQHEERTCTCGAGHGSLEGHTDWCDFTAYQSLNSFAEVQARDEGAKG